MAFHKSRYGEHGERLPCDLNGDVPEAADDWGDFAWRADDARRFSEHPRLWQQFVEQAVKMALEARAKAEA